MGIYTKTPISLSYFGASDKTRTCTRIILQPPQDCVSTNFTTDALFKYCYLNKFLNLVNGLSLISDLTFSNCFFTFPDKFFGVSNFTITN